MAIDSIAASNWRLYLKSFAQAPTLTLDYDTLNYPPMQRNIVNVSSVPHRSPFRYPGGKTWLVPYIRDWLHSKQRSPAHLIEPFAGGAIVSMTAAFERLAKHVIFCELDDAVSPVWKVVLNGHTE